MSSAVGARMRSVLAASALAALAIVLWWWGDDLRRCLGGGPDTGAVIGTWVFDREAFAASVAAMDAAPADPADGAMRDRRERYRALAATCGSLRLVLAADRCELDAGDGRTLSIPCRYANDPPDGVVVTASDPQQAWRIRLQTGPAGGLRLVDDAGMAIPLRRP